MAGCTCRFDGSRFCVVMLEVGTFDRRSLKGGTLSCGMFEGSGMTGGLLELEKLDGSR